MVNMDQIKGKINQARGDLTDDQMLKLKGHLQEAMGDSKDTGDDFMDKVSREINEMIDKFKMENRDRKDHDPDHDRHGVIHDRDAESHTDRFDV